MPSLIVGQLAPAAGVALLVMAIVGSLFALAYLLASAWWIVRSGPADATTRRFGRALLGAIGGGGTLAAFLAFLGDEYWSQRYGDLVPGIFAAVGFLAGCPVGAALAADRVALRRYLLHPKRLRAGVVVLLVLVVGSFVTLRPRTVDELLRTVERGRFPDSANALQELERRGPEARAAVSGLIAIIEQQRRQGRPCARELATLAVLGTQNDGSVAFLGQMARSKPDEAVFKALEKMGPKAHGALPDLLAAIRNIPEDSVTAEKTRRAAIVALLQVEPSSALHETVVGFVDAHVSRLSHVDARIRAGSAEVLGELGTAAERAVPALEHMSREDEDYGCRRAAHRALQNVVYLRAAH